MCCSSAIPTLKAPVMNILIFDMDAIRGDCTLPGYEGKVDLLAYHPGDLMHAGSQAGSRDFRITKYLDQSSASLLQSSLAGRNHTQAHIIIGYLDAAVVIEQLRYTLTDVMVSSISVSEQSDTPIETLTLNYLALSWQKQ